MAQSAVSSSDSAPLKLIRPTLAHLRDMDAEPTVKARGLRDLAAWYRAFAERTGNPAIWEARLLMAEDLDAEAGRIEQRRGG